MRKIMTIVAIAGFVLGAHGRSTQLDKDLNQCRKVAHQCHLEVDTDGTVSVYGRP